MSRRSVRQASNLLEVNEALSSVLTELRCELDPCREQPLRAWVALAAPTSRTVNGSRSRASTTS